MSDLQKLQHDLKFILGYVFKDLNLMCMALTHRSLDSAHNERLEFLGDAVLGMLVAEQLYLRYPDYTEGQLSQARAALVSGKQLASLARDLGLDRFVRVGNSERQRKTIQSSILSNVFEAIIAAIYIDGGVESAKKVVVKVFLPLFDSENISQSHKNYKTLLQEFLQAQGLPLPVYSLERRSGKPHNQQFEVSCLIKRLSVVCVGKGRSIRSAEQMAAKACLNSLNYSERKHD